MGSWSADAGGLSRSALCPAGAGRGRLPAVDVLVTGATGRLGRRLVPHLQDAGHRVRQMSRRGTGPGGVRGDLATGRDLGHARSGALERPVHQGGQPAGHGLVAHAEDLAEEVDVVTGALGLRVNPLVGE